MTLVTPNTSSFAADSNGWAVEGSPVTASSQGPIAAPARRADSLSFFDIPSSRLLGTRATLAQFNSNCDKFPREFLPDCKPDYAEAHRLKVFWLQAAR